MMRMVEIEGVVVEVSANYMWAVGSVVVLMAALYLLIFEGTPVNSCFAAPGYGCESSSMYQNGTLNIRLSQMSYDEMYIDAAACSSAINSSGYPMYGDPGVTQGQDRRVRIDGEPVPRRVPLSLPVQYGSSFNITLPCYTMTGLYNSSQQFDGNVWINYSLTPSGGPYLVSQVTIVLKEKPSG